MKKVLSLCILMLTIIFMPSVNSTAHGQVSYFPDEIDAGYRLPVSRTVEFEEPAKLVDITDGRLISDVGFLKYSSRTYSGNNASLTVELFELLDARAAYSLLTLLRTSPLLDGPPGDAHAALAQGMGFSQGRRFIRIYGENISEDAIKKTADAINKRIGSDRTDPPSLISHLPRAGFDASSLRYFPAIAAYTHFLRDKSASYINSRYDMEIAQARYFSGSRSGLLSLLKLPTPELAEEYYTEAANFSSAPQDGLSIYVKRIGPLIICLEGNFDPASADILLRSVQFGYSVRWVDDKARHKVIWGVPIGILGAVVNSLIFVSILCVFSIFLGALVAVVRFLRRTAAAKHSPNQEEDSDISQLRLR